MRYRCPTTASVKQVAHLTKREPETIAWLEEYVRPGDHLWDVGANIGLFSIYAAMLDGVTVTAFEPVAANYATLIDALILNGLCDRVAAFPIALSDRTGLVKMFLIDLEAGSGLHALGQPVNVRGGFEAKAAPLVPVIRGKEVVARFAVPSPTHIKIDVDGHEMRVLQGLAILLPGIRTIWIETTPEADRSGENARIESFLNSFGFSRGHLRANVSGENTLFINEKLGDPCRGGLR